MDEVTIFGLDYFKANYPERLQERFKGMDLEQETPELIMDWTKKLGFRDDYDRFTISLSRMFGTGVWVLIH